MRTEFPEFPPVEIVHVGDKQKTQEETKMMKDFKDCVSREQALLTLTGKNLSTKSTGELIALFNKRIKALPPVKPVQKTGKWIKCYTEEGYDTYADRFEFATYKCSECGRTIHDVGIGTNNPYGKKIEDYPYCHCGSKNEVEE